jgi:hypothetical protein
MPNIDFANAPVNAEYVSPDAKLIDVAIDPITITAVNAPVPATISIQRISYELPGDDQLHCLPCSSPQTVHGITIAVNAAGTSVLVNGTPAVSHGTLVFRLRATYIDGDGDPHLCDRTYRIPFTRVPVDLALVLDRSGSMGWGYDGTGSVPAGQRRWDGLVHGIDVMADHLASFAIADDTLGLRYFATDAFASANPHFSGNLVGIQDKVGHLAGAVGSETPSGWTAMGDGIVLGRDMLSTGAAGHRKEMIVFTDGMQNRGDQIKTTGTGIHTETEGGQVLGVDANGNPITIHTICLGYSGAHPMLMAGIAAAHGGKYLNTPTEATPDDVAAAEHDLTTFFATQTNAILSGGSPQYVDLLRATFPAAGQYDRPEVKHSFLVNRGVRTVKLVLIASNRYEPHFVSLEKDGVELLDYAEQTNGSGFVAGSLSYPLPGDGYEVTEEGTSGGTLDGEWTVRAGLGTTPGTAVPFALLVIVDDELIRPSYSVGSPLLKVGEALPLSVTLHRIGTALANAQVQAIVARPGDDVNHLLAITSADYSLDPDDPNQPDSAKLAALLQDPDFVEQIRAKKRVVALTYDAATEAYTASVDDLDTAGVHQVIYRVSADDPDAGRIRRFYQESVYVRFEDVDLNGSQVSVGTDEKGGSIVTFRPRTRRGRFIGPGWGAAIGLDADGASIGQVQDHGDGSYTLHIEGTLSGRGTLTLADERVFDGDLRDLGRPAREPGIIDRIRDWLESLGVPGCFLWPILLLLAILAWLFTRRKD